MRAKVDLKFHLILRRTLWLQLRRVFLCHFKFPADASKMQESLKRCVGVQLAMARYTPSVFVSEMTEQYASKFCQKLCSQAGC